MSTILIKVVKNELNKKNKNKMYDEAVTHLFSLYIFYVYKISNNDIHKI